MYVDAVEIGCDGKIGIWWLLSDIRHTGTCVYVRASAALGSRCPMIRQQVHREAMYVRTRGSGVEGSIDRGR